MRTAKMVHRWAKSVESLVACATKFGEHGRIYGGGFLQELLVRRRPEKVLNWNVEKSGNFEQNASAFPNSKEALDSRTLLVAKCGTMDTPQISIPNGRAMLAQFIRQRTTQAKFARDVGCSESHLSLVLSGNRGVSFALAKRISKATGGKIPVSVLPHEAAEAAE